MGVGPYLERMLAYEPVYGFNYNRIVDALTNKRTTGDLGQPGVNMLESYDVCFGYQPVDSTHNARCRFHVHTNVDTLASLMLHFSLQPFHVGNQTTAGGTTSSAGGDHQHLMLQDTGTFVGTGSILGYELYNARDSVGNFLEFTEPVVGPHGIADRWTFGTSGPHTHSIPSLPLNPPSAIYEAGMAQGVHVFVDGVDETTPLGGPFGTGSPADITDLNIAPYVLTSGWHEIQLSSTSIGGITTQIELIGLVNGSIV